MTPGPAQTLLVSERFVSLQGEGVSQGEPAAFLRLGRCNLTCTFCDTPYTWDFENYSMDEELSEISQAELVAWVLREGPGRLIVTGGEPLIQQKQLVFFFEALDRARQETGGLFDIIEIETNGTVPPRPELESRVQQWNVSPKLCNSGQPRERAVRPEALGRFAHLEGAYFKFVVRDDQDAEEALELVRLLSLPAHKVIFMPEARDSSELKVRGPRVAQLALRSRVRYSSRMHLELFGGGRGV